MSKTRQPKKRAQGKEILFAGIMGIALLLVSYNAMQTGMPSQGSKQEKGVASQKSRYTDVSESADKVKSKPRVKGIEIPAYLNDRPEEIVRHEGFTLSYNNKHLLPNWVAWVLTAQRVAGKEKRADNFQPDTAILKGPIAMPQDYRRSGYDRGHMCPAADCKYTRQAQNDCFLMSNIVPQRHELNAGGWAMLEEICRRWAIRYDSIYVVCGPILCNIEHYERIGQNGVSVPQLFFKAILRIDKNTGAQAIGFVFDQNDSRPRLQDYVLSVDSIEVLTGINLFCKLPYRTAQRIEANVDITAWPGL